MSIGKPALGYINTVFKWVYFLNTVFFLAKVCVSGITHHIIIATSRMMASLRESKKSLRACPCSFILPMIKPKHIENTTRPRALTPLVAPGRGITSSWVISWVALVRLNIESFTITFTWMILLPYWVLNYRRKKRRRELVLKMSKNQSDLRINFIWSWSYYFDLGILIARNVPQPWFRERHFSICLKYVIF